MSDTPKRHRRRATPPTPVEQITRGYQAKTELGRTEEAFLDVRDDLLEAIAGTSLDQHEARERLYAVLWGLGRARDVLMAYVNDGAYAEASEKALREIAAGQALN